MSWMQARTGQASNYETPYQKVRCHPARLVLSNDCYQCILAYLSDLNLWVTCDLEEDAYIPRLVLPLHPKLLSSRGCQMGSILMLWRWGWSSLRLSGYTYGSCPVIIRSFHMVLRVWFLSISWHMTRSTVVSDDFCCEDGLLYVVGDFYFWKIILAYSSRRLFVLEQHLVEQLLMAGYVMVSIFVSQSFHTDST
jgi:hypothetical protein